MFEVKQKSAVKAVKIDKGKKISLRYLDFTALNCLNNGDIGR